jgi:Sec-independent protein translocase protein TatA
MPAATDFSEALPTRPAGDWGIEMTEFWIILVVGLLIFATSRAGDLGKILSERWKNAKNVAKDGGRGEQKP